MKKTLIIILIIMLVYLGFISIFTNRKSICEPLINLEIKDNQYVTWIDNKDKDKQQYVPIKYSQITSGADGEPDWTLIATLFRALASTPFKDLVGQEEIDQAIKTVTASPPTFFQFSQEPIFLIKAVQAIKLTRNKVITIKLITPPNGNYILKPNESTFNPTEVKLVHNNSIPNKFINLNKVLVLDSDSTRNPITNYMDYMNCNLIKIHDHTVDSESIPIYILGDASFSNNANIKVSIY